MLVAFMLWERTQAEPLLPHFLFGDRNFLLMNWVVSAAAFGMLGLSFLLPIYLQSGLGLTPFQAGLSMAPMPLALMIAAPFAGRMADSARGKYIPMIGLFFLVGCMGLVAWLATAHVSRLTFVAAMALGGLGIAFVMPPSTTIAMRNISPQAAGAASGLLNTTRQLGGVIGSAAVGALLQNRLAAAMQDQVAADIAQPSPARQHFIDAFVGAMGFTLLVPITVVILTAIGYLAVINKPGAGVETGE